MKEGRGDQPASLSEEPYFDFKMLAMEKKLCSCGVPDDIHNPTCCGWDNANVICFEGEESIPAAMSAEEKEIRWLIYQSQNSIELIKWLNTSKIPIVITGAQVVLPSTAGCCM